MSKNFTHSIHIYYLDNTFYVVGLVRKPPLGLRTQVLPVFTAPDNSAEELSLAIDSARQISDPSWPSAQESQKRENWDGDKEKVWNTSQKSWDVFWEEDGSISISSSKPYKKHGKSMEWRYVPEVEKHIPASVSPLRVAQEILNQV